MAHQSLYRKYRPQSFEDVAGQSHVTRTLRNAVESGNVAHAYLFTGPRGTGKTTTARILAKALNCEKGPTPEPDNECESCVEIAEGRHPDVYELDAASRTGVDAVRDEIINKVQFASTRGRAKIYIIDEVHMLSTSAFNALLKTVEEPPPHTYFVLCTTHPHKVPETIQSRCQRFDFHRIGVEDISARLRAIADAEEIEVADSALTLIARHAAGGMRDAISTLEQLAAFTGRKIALDDVEGLLGEVDSALLFAVTDLIASRDIAGAFRFVAQLAEAGTDTREFVSALTKHFRDLLVATSAGDPAGIVDADAESLARLSDQAAELGYERVARCITVLGELASEMRWAPDPRLSLEVALTRMSRPGSDMTIEALAERVSALEAGAPPAARTPSAPAKRADRDRTEGALDSAAIATGTSGGAEAGETREVALASHDALDRAKARRAWPAVMAELKKSRAARSFVFLGTQVDADGDTLVVEFPRDARVNMELAEEADSRDSLGQALVAVLGVRPPVRFQLGRGEIRHDEGGEVPAPPERLVPDVESARDSGADTPPANGHEELHTMLVDEFGAEVVVRHEHDEG